MHCFSNKKHHMHIQLVLIFKYYIGVLKFNVSRIGQCHRVTSPVTGHHTYWELCNTNSTSSYNYIWTSYVTFYLLVLQMHFWREYGHFPAHIRNFGRLIPVRIKIACLWGPEENPDKTPKKIPKTVRIKILDFGLSRIRDLRVLSGVLPYPHPPYLTITK